MQPSECQTEHQSSVDSWEEKQFLRGILSEGNGRSLYPVLLLKKSIKISMKKIKQKYEWVDDAKMHVHEKFEAEQTIVQGEGKSACNPFQLHAHSLPFFWFPLA